MMHFKCIFPGEYSWVFEFWMNGKYGAKSKILPWGKRAMKFLKKYSYIPYKIHHKKYFIKTVTK